MEQIEKIEFSKKFKEVYTVFRQKYPNAFPPKGSPETKPLAIGIRGEIVRDNPDIEWFLIAIFIAWYTKRDWYLRALASCSYRVNLDGSQATEVTKEQRIRASQELTKLQSVLLKKKAA